MIITSPHNEKLKEIRKLSRQPHRRFRDQRFVAEGEDLLAAADAAGWIAAERYCASGSGLAGVEVEAKLLDSVSGLGSGTRTLAVYEERWAPAPLGPLCIYLHGVGDPGNVGAVVRSAQAFGASCVALGPGSADPYGPKAVRASMGAVFGVALARADGAGELPGRKIALVARAGVVLDKLSREDLEQATLLVGAEREGLPESLVAAADRVAHIPIDSHSLNAAMAATIALYEVTRMARG
jgi:RNA methyltransferase, TrmH family